MHGYINTVVAHDMGCVKLKDLFYLNDGKHLLEGW